MDQVPTRKEARRSRARLSSFRKYMQEWINIDENAESIGLCDKGDQ